MAKPTNLAAWGATSAIVEPSTPVKSAGWLVNQRLPPQWLNWWMNAVALWMVWLDAFESTTHNWLAGQNFNRGVVIQGNAAFGGGLGASIMGASTKVGVMGGASAIGIPWAIINTGGVAGTSAVDLVIPIGGDVTGIPLRVYKEITTGGSVNGPGGIDPAHVGLLARVWGLFEATRILVDGILTIDVAATLVSDGVADFNNLVNFNGGAVFGTAAQFAIPTDFDAEIDVESAGAIATVDSRNTGGTGAGAPAGKFVNADINQPAVNAEPATGLGIAYRAKGQIELTGTLPNGATAIKDQITRLNIPKGFARIHLNGTATPAIDKSFNVSGIAQDSGGTITVSWAQDFADGNYAVFVNGNDTPNYNYQAGTGGARVGGSVTLVIADYAGTQLNRAGSSGKYVDVFAFGDQ